MHLILLLIVLFLTGCEKKPLVQGAITLTPMPQTIIVDDKGYERYFLQIGGGKKVLILNKGDEFNVVVKNELPDPTCIHWHGLIVPYTQDGVPFVSQLPIDPQKSYPYHFKLIQSGTYWMHSHFGLQEQRLLAAPLILLDPENPIQEDQDLIMMLEDFSFTDPHTLFYQLQHQKKKAQMGPDLVEIDYDAYLANQRTLSDPEVIYVNPGSSIYLRIINGSSSTNFFIHLGELEAEAVAVDGNPIVPLKGNQFELANAQRVDVRFLIPLKESAYPIIAIGEGTDKQAGIILATPDADIPNLSEKAASTAPALSYSQEKELRALHPLLPKPIDRRLNVVLGGSMIPYVWTMNGQAWPHHTPLMVKEGERVEITFTNPTTMSHPMHLHGHVVQVKEIDGLLLNGAMRDTVLIKPGSTVKVEFDATNPGIWAFHCHLLYHRVAGMFTTLNYEDVPSPSFIPK